MRFNRCSQLRPWLLGTVACLALGTEGLRAGSADPKEIAVEPVAPVQPEVQSIWNQKYLTGDWGGARTRLENEGVTFSGNDVGDMLTDVTGSQSHHVTYFGRARLSLDINLQKLADYDGEFFITGIYQYGRNLSADYLNVNTLTSSIAGRESLRLDEAWYQQGFLDSRIKLKVGQVAAVNEFGATDFGDILFNDELGYAPNALFPTRQPFSPAGKPGAIVKIDLRDLLPGLYFKFGGYTAYRDAYSPDNNGLHWANDFSHGMAISGEVGYLEQKTDYAGTYKLGFNYTNTAGYVDLQTGAPLTGDYTIYAIAEKSVYHPQLANGKLDPKKGLDLLMEMVGAPDDRNLLHYEFTTGGRYTGLFPQRPDDKVGFGLIYSDVSEAASDASQALGGPSLGGETTVELDYQVAVTPWLQVQPDVQEIFNPRGNANRADILVLGLRTVVIF